MALKKTETQIELEAAPLTIEANPKISTRYNYPSISRPEVDFPQTDPNSRSITNQSDKESTDINLIMKKYEKSGMITDLITGEKRQPVYGDFSDVGDYHQLQTRLIAVNEAFNALSASIKNRFDNDPHQLVEFLADPQNDAEAIKLGLKTLTPAQIAVQDAAAAAAAAKQAADAKAAAALAANGQATG